MGTIVILGGVFGMIIAILASRERRRGNLDLARRYTLISAACLFGSIVAAFLVSRGL